MVNTKPRKLSEFGIVTDIDTENMDKWEMGDKHIITGVVLLSGEYGPYPGFETEDGKILIVGGQVIMRTAEQLKEVFGQFKDVSFNLELQEKESKTGRMYNVLLEVNKA